MTLVEEVKKYVESGALIARGLKHWSGDKDLKGRLRGL